MEYAAASDPLPTVRPGHGPFRGWKVVFATFWSNFMATGTQFYVFNALMLPLCLERGWSRAEINYAPMLGFSLGLLFQLLYGLVLNRIGPRLVMSVGPLLAAAAFISLGHTHSIAVFYLLFICLVAGNGTLNGVVANTTLSNWFINKRGKAMGLASAGVSFSGAVLPPVAMFILERTSLETTFIWVGSAILILAPLNWLLIRDTPEACGQWPDGQPPAPAGVLGGSAEQFHSHQEILDQGLAESTYTARQLLHQQDFWMVGLSFALTMMGVVGVMFQLGPRFLDLGFDKNMAMYMVCAATMVGAVGKYAWGLLCDKFDPRRVVAGMMITNALGLLIGAIPGGWVSGVLFVVIFGFGMGGAIATYPVITAHIYGRLAFVHVYRLMVLFLVLEGLGTAIMGNAFELTGSYDAAYLIFAGINVIAALMISRVSPRHSTS